MQKYILSGLTSAAALLLVVSPVSAYWPMGGFNHYQPKSGVEITNIAEVDNKVTVRSNTGDNSPALRTSVRDSGRLELRNTMFTGNATAYGEVINQVNNGDDCGCLPSRSKLEILNKADVDTDLEVIAKTGDNSQSMDTNLYSKSSKPAMYTHYFRGHSYRPTRETSTSLKAENFMDTGNASAEGFVWNVVNSDYQMTQ